VRGIPSAVLRWDANRRVWMITSAGRAGPLSVRTARVVKAVIYGLVLVTGGLLLDFAVNVVTGGTLPGPLDRYRWFAWPTIGAMFALSMAAAVRERLVRRESGPPPEVEPAPEPPTGPSNLPPAVGEFTGREADLAELRRLLPPGGAGPPAAPVVVTICGLAGVGKSTLAVRFAHEVRRRYPDAQLYVDLQGTGPEPLDPVDALGRLVRALGTRERDLPMDLESLASTYRAGLQGKRAIVVLDHAADGNQVRHLLPGLTSCLVLITSLHPLDEPISGHLLRLGGMGEGDALALLATIAGDHVRSPENVDAARRVASLCGHLPLALSIAGVLLRRNSRRPVSELELELTGKRNVLGQFQRGGLDVRVGFDVSYAYLEPRERMLFRRLCLLPDPTFGAEMAAVLLDCPTDEAERLLDRLVEEQVLERAGDGRFMLQNLLRLYAEERLDQEPRGEQRAALERVLRRGVERATAQAALLDPGIAELGGGDPSRVAASLEEQLGALDWFERERTHLLKVVRQAADIDAHDIVWRMAAALVPFFDLRGHRTDWAEVQAAAMRSIEPDGPLRARAWTELGTGRLRWLEGDHGQALAHLEEALETAMAGGWGRLEARARYLMGRVAHEAGRHGDALVRYQRAFDRFGELGQLREQANAMLYTTRALHECGRVESAAVLRSGDAILCELRSRPEDLWAVRTMGRVMDYLGHVAEGMENHELAGMHFIGSGEAFRKIGFWYGFARARRQVGRIRLQQNSVARALAFLQGSVGLFRAIGDRHGEGRSLGLAGEAHLAAGDAAEARRCWEEAQDALAETDPAAADAMRLRLAGLAGG
jgi:tetratricopeptide (TPR) repeat protein